MSPILSGPQEGRRRRDETLILFSFFRPSFHHSDKESEITAAEKKKSVADRRLTSVEALVTSDKVKITEKQKEVKGERIPSRSRVPISSSLIACVCSSSLP